jgi:hypothetical protein
MQLPFAIRGEGQAGPNVLLGDVRKLGQQFLVCHATCQVFARL